MAFGNYNYNPYINPYVNPYNAPQTAFNQPMQFNAQPPQMPQQAPRQASNGFVWVNNIDEANTYMVAPNSAVQLWDKNNPCVYLKTADAAGKPTMQIFDLVERKENTEETQNKAPTIDFALKSDLLDLEQRVSDLEALKRRTKAKETKEEVEDA